MSKKIINHQMIKISNVMLFWSKRFSRKWQSFFSFQSREKYLCEKSYSNFVLFVLQIFYLSSHPFLDKCHCVHFLLEFVPKNCGCILTLLHMLVQKDLEFYKRFEIVGTSSFETVCKSGF